jgi:TolB-like protein
MFHEKSLFVFLLAGIAAASLFGQTKPRLAILPFTGPVVADAESIAEFFSYEAEINRVFTPVPRTSAVENVMKEHQFQRSGLTDSDTIAELGKQLNADYVLAGHIAELGAKKLLLITIINVKELQQVAGDYREYQRIEDTPTMLPDMAKRIAAVARQDTKDLPRLAVLPFNVLSSGMNQDDAEMLAQILATELANSGRYAVFPRTKAIEKVMEEHRIERSGMTDPENIKIIGEALNAQYVLSANVRKVGEDNYFSASIIHIEEASQGLGSRKQYRDVSDGLVIMPKLARDLTGESAEIGPFRSDAWENSRLYAGLRLGGSPRFYELSGDIGSGKPKTGGSFEIALYASAYLVSYFGIEFGVQTELWFGADTVSYSGTDDGGDFSASFVSSSLEIPLLAKALYRLPGGFFVSLFTGPYFSIPLGKIEYKTDGGTDSYDANIPAGWLIGVAPGMRLGPGTLFADIRYGGEAGKTSISDSNGVLSVYSRGMLSFTVGYELGFFGR